LKPPEIDDTNDDKSSKHSSTTRKRTMIEMTAAATQQIRDWAAGLDNDVVLRYAVNGHAQDASISAFAKQMAAETDRVRLKKEGDVQVPRPTLFAADHVAYQALPLDRELEPFLTVLAGKGRAFEERIAPENRRRLARLRAPALLTVYVTSHCPFCPTMLTTVLGLAACSDYVWVTVIDGEVFPEAAQKDRVSAAPTLILDDRLRWTGSVDPEELVTLMLDRDPANLGTEALRGLIEAGDAQGVAEMMMARGSLFPAFLELLAHPRWSVRLGAMVAFETLAEEAGTLAGQVVDPVVAAFPAADDSVKGDLLHVLGESGNPAAVPFLKRIAVGDVDDEVRSAAREALEKIGGRQG
jgi:hypothetical protein